jgi:5'-nucleotidase / UDP-sugar diphosphatase
MNIMRLFVLLSGCSVLAPALANTEHAQLIFSSGLSEIVTEQQGGFAELATVLEIYRSKPAPTFFVFGGGGISPSILSSFDHGVHIIDLLNSLEPDVMGVEKGDFGFFEDELSLRSYEAAFPIVASNIAMLTTKRNLDGILDAVLLEQGAYKFGFISILGDFVIEEYNLTQVELLEPFAAIKFQAQQLREQGAQLIVLHNTALQVSIDELLSSGIVDVVLMKVISAIEDENGIQPAHHKHIVLTQPEQVAIVTLAWQTGDLASLTVDAQINQLSNYPKQAKVQLQINSYTNRLNLLLDEQICKISMPLITTRLSVRTEDNLFANLLTDALKAYTNADIALINGGTIRGDTHYPVNSVLRRRDIARELPYRSEVVLLDISGEQLLLALENGLSLVEHERGRFPQVSGMQVVYDPQAPAGHRIVSVQINQQMLNLSQRYRLASSAYLALGGDGYDMLKGANQLKYDNKINKEVSAVFIEYLRAKGTIAVTKQARISTLTQTQHSN